MEERNECAKSTDDTRVPKVVYFVIFGEPYKFRFWNYVAFMAAKRFVKPTGLYLIGDVHPSGYWWRRTLRDCKGLRFLYRPRPKKIGGKNAMRRQHMSDIVRLQALLLNGGIYLDADMVVTRPLDALLHYDITMGLLENGTGMGNAFIAARRNSPFVRQWYSEYNNYDDKEYYYNSLHVPRNMWHRNGSRIHMESARLYRPNWFEVDLLFKRTDFDWSQNYAVHIWYQGGKNHVPETEAEIQTTNTTIAQIFRNALYGHPRIRKDNNIKAQLDGEVI